MRISSSYGETRIVSTSNRCCSLGSLRARMIHRGGKSHAEPFDEQASKRADRIFAQERQNSAKNLKSMTANDAPERVAFVPFPFFVVKFLGQEGFLIGLRTVSNPPASSAIG
jgi:hypothetical protein